MAAFVNMLALCKEESIGLAATIRELLASRSPFLRHFTLRANFDSIRRRGLLPSNPWRAFGELDETGEPERVFVCLTPFASKTPVAYREPGEHFLLAVKTDDLEEHFDADTSFDAVTPKQGETTEEARSRVIVNLAIENSSIAYRRSIPPTLLRVRCAQCGPDNPGEWPLLLDTPEEMVHFDKVEPLW